MREKRNSLKSPQRSLLSMCELSIPHRRTFASAIGPIVIRPDDRFMRDESDDLESDEEEVENADGRRRKRSRREKVAERDAKKAKLKSDIAKAAGSELTG